jgi:transcriptional regulator with XRE-family HTH domain
MAPVKKNRPKLRRTFLREWREFRGLNQEQAGERLNMDRSNLSRVERGEVPYSQGLLEAAAEAYDCEPWDLLNVNPLKEGDVVDLTVMLKSAQTELRAEIIGFAKGRLLKH